MRRIHLLPLALLLAAPAAVGQQSWTIPGVVKTSGQNGTNFVSDVVLTNPGAFPAIVMLQFVPSLGQLPVLYTLGPQASVTLRDVVASVFGASQAVGALAVLSDQPLILRGRTYNTAASGTFGVALPVVADDRLLGEGDVADSLWVDQGPASDRGYRTNVAVAFPDAGGGAATVTLYDALGNAAGTKEFSLDSAGLQQLGAGSFATGALPVGRARIEVKRGRASGYCVVNDNVTGDGSLFPFEALPAGVQDVVVNGVARAGGANGTFWRSDVRLFNPNDADAAVTAFFHAAGDSNPSPVTVSLSVPAGRILDLPDVLGTLMGVPVGSSGALRFQSDSAVAVLCRTSNLDPTGQRAGTFGAQQKAVPLLSYLTSADAGAVIPGVRQGSAFRTNVGFSAGADGASWGLTLKNASGATLAQASGSLGAFGWTQPNVGGLFPGTIPDGAQIFLAVTSGSLDIFDSSIDNGSGDSVVTPISPLPAGVPATATIGPAGGAVRSADGRLTLKVPAGALPAPTVFSIQAASTPAPNGTDSGYIVSGGATFARDALLVLAYSRLESVNAGMLGLALQPGTDWYGLTGGSLDVAARTLTVPLQTMLPASPARAALAVPGSVTVGAYEGWIMAPWQVAAVVEGSATVVDFTVSGVGPGSTESRGRGTVKLTRQAPGSAISWYANGLRGGSSATGRVTGGETGHYSAPPCAPKGGLVHLDATFTRTKEIALHADVWVYPRSWEVTVAWTLETICPIRSTGTTFAWKAGNTMRGSFVLNDDLSIEDTTLAPVAPEQSTVQPTLCPGSDTKCTYLTLTLNPYPWGRFYSIEGGWSRSVGRLGVDLVVTSVGAPAVTSSNSSCDPPRPPITSTQQGFIAQQASFYTSPAGYHFSDKKASDYSSGVNGETGRTVDITPARSPGCN